MNIRNFLSERLRAAMHTAGVPDDCPPLVTQSTKPQFGDYQANGAMGAAKRLRTNPRQLAQATVAALDLGDAIEFINIHLSPAWLGDRLTAVIDDPRLGIARADPGQTVIVDYSSPNLAKEMHVGHLRSTIIGDALARLLEHLGQRVTWPAGHPPESCRRLGHPVRHAARPPGGPRDRNRGRRGAD